MHAIPTFGGRSQPKYTRSVLSTDILRKNLMAQKWCGMAQASTKAVRPGKCQTSSRLICKTATLHVQHAFLVHFFIVTARAQREIS